MFGINDIPKFFLAFFLVLPIVSLVHEAGHVFFAFIMGGKNIKVTIGTGKVLFRAGLLEVRTYYFYYGQCSFDNLKRNHRFANFLIFSGGALFNAATTVFVMYLIENNTLEPNMGTYQFTYFSLYYIFFALLPMAYPDGSNSDGKILLDLIRNKNQAGMRTYRVQWGEEKRQWGVLDHDHNEVYAFEEEEQALDKAHEMAQFNRPSRLLHCKNGKEVEVRNYPRVPL